MTHSFHETIRNMTTKTKVLLDEWISSHEIPGIQYIVTNANGIIFEYAGGVCDVKHPHTSAVSSRTCFLTSSSTKVLTATAVMKLVDQKLVDLDETLSTYFQKHPYGDEIKIRHLLNHSSGIPNPMPLKWLHTEQEHCSFSENDALLNVMEENPHLCFSPPGQKYAYSNISYWLLGKVIENVSGKTFQEFLHDEICNPLNIDQDQMFCDVPDTRNVDMAKGHQSRFSILTLLFTFLTSRKIWESSLGRWSIFKMLYMNGAAYGGVFASAKYGFVTFLQDMLKEDSKLLSASSKQCFFSNQMDLSGHLLPTTLGWHRGYIDVDNHEPLQHMYFGKPGGGPGYHSNVRIYPELGIGTVFLANKTEVSANNIIAISDRLDKEFLIDAMQKRLLADKE